MNVAQNFELALKHHQSGRLEEAEALYREILAQEPRHPDALHLLGMAASEMGDVTRALELLKQAIAIKPNSPIYYVNMGSILNGAGRLEEALAAYRKAIQLRPNIPEAYNNMGNTLRRMGRMDEALGAYSTALSYRADYAEPYNNMGTVFKGQDKLDQAIAAYGKAIQLRPNFAEAYSNLSNALRLKDRVDDAIAACQTAITLNPRYADGYCNLGAALAKKGLLEEALAANRKAVELKPDLAEAHNNLGSTLTDLLRFPEAMAEYQRAIEIKPDYLDAYNNIGTALKNQGHIEGAMEAYRRAIAIKGDYPDAHYNLAHMLFLTGDVAGGCREYEWRWKVKSLSPARPFGERLWSGEAVGGKTILLHAEQGLGDTLQFIRYAPLLAERGAKVMVECQPQLVRLLARMEGVQSVYAWGQPLPRFDYHCPMLSLPLAFGTRLETIPINVPYLAARGGSGSGREEKTRNVGLVWAGNPDHKNDKNRSMLLKTLAPLGEAAVQFHSLQVGAASGQVGEVPELQLIDRGAEMKDFADTVEVVAGMDLVITVDTAVAHVAGAMGKPVWVMLPFVPDWRWMLEREDSPWYPTMRLFRQQKARDWNSVVTKIFDALKERYS